MANKPKDNRDYTENTDKEAGRNPSKANDYKGEAQNVNDDTGRPLGDAELGNARNKANESKGKEDSQ